MAERLAASCGMEALKDLAKAMGIQKVPVQGRRMTRADLAKCMYERVAELRVKADRHDSMKASMMDMAQALVECQQQVEEQKTLSLLSGEDGADIDDERDFLHNDGNEAFPADMSLGEPDPHAEFGVFEGDLVKLTIRSMWSDFCVMHCLPTDTVEQLEGRIVDAFGFAEASEVQLFKKAQGGNQQLGYWKTIGEYFVAGEEGELLLGCTLRGGGGGDMKRHRGEDGAASTTSALVSGDEGEEDDKLMEEGLKDEKGVGQAVELMETVRTLHGRLLDHYLDVSQTINQVDVHVERLTVVGTAEHFKALLFNKVAFPKLKQLAAAQWLSSRNGRWAYTKLAVDYIFEEEFKFLATTLKLTVALKKCAVAVVSASIKGCGLGTAHELITSTLAERAVLVAAREEEKKKKTEKKGFLGRLLG